VIGRAVRIAGRPPKGSSQPARKQDSGEATLSPDQLGELASITTAAQPTS
jgi:hypothetical protein